MERAILVINCGSSSLKFSVIEPQSGAVLASGLAERLGSQDARVSVRIGAGGKRLESLNGGDHSTALDTILSALEGFEIAGVGHRVVHGGESFSHSVQVDDSVVAEISACSALAPLHNPAALLGLAAAREKFPLLPHVTVFDTAFHQTLPPRAFLYAIPHEIYERHKARRYGFHGTSHRYVAGEAARLADRDPARFQIISAHLGNGSSACAIKNGASVDTTMGLTPLEGLVMGTRSGDVDPNLHQFLAEKEGLDLAAITDLLNRKSGLLGISGLSNDMRTLAEAAAAGHERAALAIDVFCYRLAKALLSLAAALERIDAIVFTGGIGENAAGIRAQTLGHLKVLGPDPDPSLNASHGRGASGRITTEQSRLLVMVVPTNEELVIARETAAFLPSS